MHASFFPLFIFLFSFKQIQRFLLNIQTIVSSTFHVCANISKLAVCGCDLRGGLQECICAVLAISVHVCASMRFMSNPDSMLPFFNLFPV